MNIYYVTFIKTDSYYPWKFITKIYRAGYEDEAFENATRDWKKNFQGWRMTFYRIPYFDEFNSAKISEINK